MAKGGSDQSKLCYGCIIGEFEFKYTDVIETNLAVVKLNRFHAVNQIESVRIGPCIPDDNSSALINQAPTVIFAIETVISRTVKHYPIFQ